MTTTCTMYMSFPVTVRGNRKRSDADRIRFQFSTCFRTVFSYFSLTNTVPFQNWSLRLETFPQHHARDSPNCCQRTLLIHPNVCDKNNLRPFIAVVVRPTRTTAQTLSWVVGMVCLFRGVLVWWLRFGWGIGRRRNNTILNASYNTRCTPKS